MNDALLKTAIIEDVERTHVPAFDLFSVRARKIGAEQAPRFPRKRAWMLPSSLVLLPALAAAAVIFPSPQVRNAIAQKLALWSPPLRPANIVYVVGRPVTQLQARRIAVFHLVMPGGLPTGTRLSNIDENGLSGDSFTATYILPSGRQASFELRKALPHSRYVPWVAQFSGGAAGVGKAVRVRANVWIAGDEVVTAISRSLSAKQFMAIKTAMHARDAPQMNP